MKKEDYTIFVHVDGGKINFINYKENDKKESKEFKDTMTYAVDPSSAAFFITNDIIHHQDDLSIIGKYLHYEYCAFGVRGAFIDNAKRSFNKLIDAFTWHESATRFDAGIIGNIINKRFKINGLNSDNIVLPDDVNKIFNGMVGNTDVDRLKRSSKKFLGNDLGYHFSKYYFKLGIKKAYDRFNINDCFQETKTYINLLEYYFIKRLEDVLSYNLEDGKHELNMTVDNELVTYVFPVIGYHCKENIFTGDVIFM